MIGVIAAGGKGTRLSSITTELPKPMVPINGKPILHHQIECLKNNGINQIYLLIGHLGQTIREYFKDGSDFGVHIEYIQESVPLGSAGSLYFLKDIIKEDFAFVFGDLIFDIDFSRMLAFHQANNASITLLSHPNSHPFDSDLIVSDSTNLVTAIDSKQNVRNYDYHNLVNAGIYILSPTILNSYFPILGKSDFEKDIIRAEIPNQRVYSYRSTEYVKDAGTPDRYYSICEDVRNGTVQARSLRSAQKCIFIDRDGTINKEKGFISSPDQIELECGVADAIKAINRSGYLLIVITNQPVIARGEATFQQIEKIHMRLETLLGKNGAYYDDLFFCPHHPDKGFEGEIPELKIDCDCRKPKIGLLLKAKEKYNIDFANSFFVGDTTMDIMTGVAAGIKTVLVRTGYKGEDGKYPVKADYTVDTLPNIIPLITKQ